MLERLEAADRHAELLALLHIGERIIEQSLPESDHFGGGIETNSGGDHLEVGRAERKLRGCGVRVSLISPAMLPSARR